jgi:hypothetical protein
MGKGIGIAAFVLVMISIAIPVLGNFMCIAALLLAAVAAFAGNRTWPVVSSIVGGVNLFLWSPTWMILMYSRTVETRGGLPMHTMESTYTGYFYLTWLVVLLPIGVVAYRAMTTKTPLAATPPDGGAS